MREAKRSGDSLWSTLQDAKAAEEGAPTPWSWVDDGRDWGQQSQPSEPLSFRRGNNGDSRPPPPDTTDTTRSENKSPSTGGPSVSPVPRSLPAFFAVSSVEQSICREHSRPYFPTLSWCGFSQRPSNAACPPPPPPSRQIPRGGEEVLRSWVDDGRDWSQQSQPSEPLSFRRGSNSDSRPPPPDTTRRESAQREPSTQPERARGRDTSQDTAASSGEQPLKAQPPFDERRAGGRAETQTSGTTA